jgi:hypothetical protein
VPKNIGASNTMSDADIVLEGVESYKLLGRPYTLLPAWMSAEKYNYV